MGWDELKPTGKCGQGQRKIEISRKRWELKGLMMMTQLADNKCTLMFAGISENRLLTKSILI